MFGKLVSPNASDTLQIGLQEAFQNYANVLDRLHVSPAYVFDELLSNLNARLDSELADLGHLLKALAEFRTIVGTYSTQCIEPIFRSMPKDVQEMLKPTSRATLNSFRERYIHFLTEYAEFTEELEGSLRSAPYHAPHVFRPDELTA